MSEAHALPCMHCQLLPDGSHSYRRWRALLTCLLLLGVFCVCAGATAGRPRQPGHPYTRPCKQPQQRQRRSWNASAPAMRTHAQGTQKGASLAIPSLHTTYHIHTAHDSLWVAHPVATEDMSRVKHSLKPIQCGCGTAMAHWSRPQTSNFCIAPVPPKWLLCAHPAEDKTLSESAVITWRIPKGRTQAISYTKKKPGSGKHQNLRQAINIRRAEQVISANPVRSDKCEFTVPRINACVTQWLKNRSPMRIAPAACSAPNRQTCRCVALIGSQRR